jgi:hypothetical protein
LIDPNAIEAGDRVNAAPEVVVPVPVSATEAGVLVPLLLTTRVPEETPFAVGLYATETVQFAPDFSAVVQVVADITKGAETVSAESANVSIPVLVTVTFWAPVITPTVSVPNASEVGESERLSVDAALPVPVRDTEAGVLVPLLLTTRVPDEATAEVGL